MDQQLRRLQHWLKERVDGDGPMSVTLIKGAISNENYAIDWGPHRWLLRKSPAVLSHQNAHNVLREFRILKALEASGVRAPKTVIACDDRRIVGSAFYIMERVNGVVVDRLLPPSYGLSDDCVEQMAVNMIDTLVALHAVDWKGMALSDIARSKGSTEQQVRRWSAQHLAQNASDFTAVMTLSNWLRAHCPKEREVVLVHGDYQLNNMIISRQPPARLLAVIDWELATLGNPLMDLASVLLSWPTRGNAFFGSLLAGGRPQRGVKTFAQLAHQYAEKSHRDVSSLNYYLVLAAWKRAIIVESRYKALLSASSSNGNDASLIKRLRSDIESLLEQAMYYIKHPVCV